MTSCTDTFCFNENIMFETIRGSLPTDRDKTQDLLESVDDLIFAWNSTESCLLVMNWRAAKLRTTINQYQTLVPSVPQNFQVSKIIASPEGSMMCLAGSRGLSVMELPKRWGPNGNYLDGKKKITCKSYNLDENFFINNSHLELFQVRWHPGSPTDTHILSLLSDNTIRIYNEATLRHVWRVGPVPYALPFKIGRKKDGVSIETSKEKVFPTLYDMGETAVDFDIGPPRVVQFNTDESRTDNISLIGTSVLNISSNYRKHDSDKDKVEWPVIILRGNGNIYVLNVGIETEKPSLQGPLTISPQCDDNYGLDSCSILVIPSLPPTLVIAESNGKLHHALMIESEELEESFNEIDSSLNIHPSEWAINVLETVELELGIPETDLQKQHTCPIHLKRDTINELRYFAYHNTGVHAVSVNFVKELQRYVDAESVCSSVNLNAPSNAEYIVCTKVKQEYHKINSVLGCIILQMPSGLVLLLGSGEVISLNVIIDPNVLADYSTTISSRMREPTDSLGYSLTPNTPIQKIMNESFITHISNILKRTVSQPILSLDKTSGLPPEEIYKLLSQSITILKEQYFRKHEKVRTEILKRVKILKLLKEQQRKEIEQIENETVFIKQEVERLAEKYDEIYMKQKMLSAHCQDLIRQANIGIPNNLGADKEFAENVKKICETTDVLDKSLQQVRENLQKQHYHINKYTRETENKKVVLPAKQQNLIREILGEITTEIDLQVKDIKKINNVINL